MNKIYVWLVNFSLQQTMIFAVVVSLAYYFMIFEDGSSQKTEITVMETEIATEEQKKKETEVVLKEEERMKTAVRNLSQQYIEISKKIPTTLPSIELNRAIDGMARLAKVSVKSRKPMTVITSEIVDEIPVEVSMEGSFAQIAQFVYLVSTTERLAIVKSYRLTPVSQKSNKLRFEGVVVGFQQAQPKKTPQKGQKK